MSARTRLTLMGMMVLGIATLGWMPASGYAQPSKPLASATASVAEALQTATSSVTLPDASPPVPGFAPGLPERPSTPTPELGGTTLTATGADSAMEASSAASAKGPVPFEVAGESVGETDAANHEELVDRLQSDLDQLAVRINLVSDKVALVRDTALGSEVGETRVVITHKNQLGDGFFLERVNYLLDEGVLLQERDQNGSLSSVESRVLFDGQLKPGDHELSVEIFCRSGGFGVFSYVKAYGFRVSSKYAFRVREGRVNKLDIVTFQRSDITLPANERLSVRYDYNSEESSSP